MANVKLVDSYFKARGKNGAVGLSLLNDCIERLASKDADWDALSRFVVLAGTTGDRAKVVKIIRIAFGDKLKWAASKQHPTGGKFTLGWKGNEGFVLGNGYAKVRDAIAAKVSWNDAAFQKMLAEMLPEKAAPAARDIKEADVKNAAQHVYDYLLARAKRVNGLNTGDIVAEVQRMLAAQVVVKGEPAH